jgi:YihY family inner membrane protein
MDGFERVGAAGRHALERFDAVQKRVGPLSVGVATCKKFAEDESSNYAAMIAFWAFFSIFPLLLVLVTVLAWVLPVSSKDAVLNRIAQMFPLLDTNSIRGLSGSVWALVLGLATSLWSGLSAVRTIQSAFNSVWEVPYYKRSGPLEQVRKSIFVLATIGLGLVVTTLISGLAASTASGLHLGALGRIAGYVAAAVLDIGLFLASFRILTDAKITTRDVLPGALLSGSVFFVLEQLSTQIISNQLKHAQTTYGHFATVIVMLWWFYLTALVTLGGAQLNVVLKERLYPRSLVDAPTEADERALQVYARERTYLPEETIEAHVDQGTEQR